MGGALVFYPVDISKLYLETGAVALNSSSTDFIAHLLKPYIKEELGDESTEKIFAAYDEWFGPIIFSELTQDDYMRYYTIMKKVFEEDLCLNQEQSKELVQWVVKMWYDEIKPKMRRSPQFKEIV